MIEVQQEENKVNTQLKTTLEFLSNHPSGFHGSPEEQKDMAARIMKMLEDENISTNDLIDVAAGFDLNLKSLMLTAYTPYGIVLEDTIEDCIKRDDLKSILFITSSCIVLHNGKFYRISGSRFREANEISEETLHHLREYLLKKGYPLNARSVSAPSSFYKVTSLNDAVCDEATLMKYIFLAGGIQIPFTDAVSIAFFNHLNQENKEYILTQLIHSYREFSCSKVDSTIIAVDNKESGISMILPKAEFETLETDSPKKAELISLQEKYYG